MSDPIRPGRRPYTAPRLVIYGTRDDLTLTAPPGMGQTDTAIGSGNLKT
jgi:hypothetical protein